LLRGQLRSQGSDGEWLSFDAPPDEPTSGMREPEPIASFLSQAAASRIIELPPGMARWHTALSELEGTLSTWSLPTTLARRWLHAAQGLMGGDLWLELYVELDPVLHLITVELWDKGGRRVYGIDDFLAGQELYSA